MFHQNKDIFDILFEAIPEGVIVVNKKQLIVAANTSALKMFGYKKNELMNEHLNILIPSQYHKSHFTHFSNFIKSNNGRKIKHDLNLFGVKKNNKEFPVEIGLNPFSVYGDHFIIALIIDITLRKENEEKIAQLNTNLEQKVKERTYELKNTIKQLKELNLNYKEEIKKRIRAESKLKIALKKEIELNELKTKFLSMVSHEFKTPLSGILTSSMLLEKYQLNEEQPKRDKHIKTITNKVHYLNNILNDFLSIERLESNKVNYKISTFHLSKLLNEVVYNANLLLKAGQRINVPNDIDEYVLHQDERILELILSNIIHNAIKYSGENSTINIEVHQNSKKIIFKITDEGIGIPEKDQKFIFNRYFRAENALNTQGTGIGLNIVKAHLENLGGAITFTSKEHIGSEFTLELPLNLENNQL
jgi:PAS domain S-box-containing protein